MRLGSWGGEARAFPELGSRHTAGKGGTPRLGGQREKAKQDAALEVGLHMPPLPEKAATSTPAPYFSAPGSVMGTVAKGLSVVGTSLLHKTLTLRWAGPPGLYPLFSVPSPILSPLSGYPRPPTAAGSFSCLGPVGLFCKPHLCPFKLSAGLEQSTQPQPTLS